MKMSLQSRCHWIEAGRCGKAFPTTVSICQDIKMHKIYVNLQLHCLFQALKTLQLWQCQYTAGNIGALSLILLYRDISSPCPPKAPPQSSPLTVSLPFTSYGSATPTPQKKIRAQLSWALFSVCLFSSQSRRPPPLSPGPPLQENINS